MQKPRKKTSGLNASADSADNSSNDGVKPKAATSPASETKQDGDSAGQEAVYIGTSCWKIEEAGDDEFNSTGRELFIFRDDDLNHRPRFELFDYSLFFFFFFFGGGGGGVCSDCI